MPSFRWLPSASTACSRVVKSWLPCTSLHALLSTSNCPRTCTPHHQCLQPHPLTCTPHTTHSHAPPAPTIHPHACPHPAYSCAPPHHPLTCTPHHPKVTCIHASHTTRSHAPHHPTRSHVSHHPSHVYASHITQSHTVTHLHTHTHTHSTLPSHMHTYTHTHQSIVCTPPCPVSCTPSILNHVHPTPSGLILHPMLPAFAD